jgi:hypothetical protein
LDAYFLCRDAHPTTLPRLRSPGWSGPRQAGGLLRVKWEGMLILPFCQDLTRQYDVLRVKRGEGHLINPLAAMTEFGCGRVPNPEGPLLFPSIQHVEHPSLLVDHIICLSRAHHPSNPSCHGRVWEWASPDIVDHITCSLRAYHVPAGCPSVTWVAMGNYTDVLPDGESIWTPLFYLEKGGLFTWSRRMPKSVRPPSPSSQGDIY